MKKLVAWQGVLQGDQIWQILAQWAIVYSGQFFKKNTEVALNFWLLFPQSTYFVLILAKNGLGCILGDFFTNKVLRSPWCAAKISGESNDPAQMMENGLFTPGMPDGTFA
jgi:hypothetical protein